MNENENKENALENTDQSNISKEENFPLVNEQNNVSCEASPDNTPPNNESESIEANQECPPSGTPATKRKSSFLPILICLTFIVVSVCTVISIVYLSYGNFNGIHKSTIIYQNGTWENKGELVSGEAIVNTASKASPSVVAITTESVSYNAYLGNYVSEGAGSGVICTQDGYIITNHHVIDGATTIKVTLENGDTYEATLIGSDSQTDLAVIKINVEGLSCAVFAAEGSLSVGQTVVAIGNPMGTLSNTVTSGVVSALARQITISGTTMTLLQHNASVSPGNSGGGLFNINGELVGIVNAKSSGEGVEGIGFAIPVETYKKVVEELIEYGYVTGRPQLGITAYEVQTNQDIYSLPNDIRTCVMGIGSYGVYIGSDSAVTYAKNSKKLQPGDFVSSVDDQLIKEFADFSKLLSEKKAGDTVNMTVYRYNNETGKTSQVHVSIVLTQKTK